MQEKGRKKNTGCVYKYLLPCCECDHEPLTFSFPEKTLNIYVFGRH